MANCDAILKSNLHCLDNKFYICSKILDDLSGATVPHKKRWLEPLVTSLSANTTLSLSEVLRNEPESGKMIVAFRIMQYIVVSTTKIPWTPVRKENIAFHFTSSLIPSQDVFFLSRLIHSSATTQTTQKGTQTDDVNQEQTKATLESGSNSNSQLDQAAQTEKTDTEPSKRNRTQIKHRFSNSWRRTPIVGFQSLISQNPQMSRDSKLFWDTVVRYADQNKFSLRELITKLMEEAESRKSKGGKRGRDVNHIKVVVDALFQTDDKNQREKLREELTLASKTQHWSYMLQLIRSRLKVTGLGRNIIPSVRTLQRESCLLIQCFYDTMRPQHTYSGFRIDLVSAVKFVSFFKLRNEDLNGLQVDIWGDGAEIGKVNVTRLAFRILNKETETSAQSVDSVFTFACFRGEFFSIPISLFIGW